MPDNNVPKFGLPGAQISFKRVAKGLKNVTPILQDHVSPSGELDVEGFMVDAFRVQLKLPSTASKEEVLSEMRRLLGIPEGTSDADTIIQIQQIGNRLFTQALGAPTMSTFEQSTRNIAPDIANHVVRQVIDMDMEEFDKQIQDAMAKGDECRVEELLAMLKKLEGEVTLETVQDAILDQLKDAGTRN